MLRVLRKHQKGVFIIVSFVVIISFSFFGTYTTIKAKSYKKDKTPIGKTKRGRAITAEDIKPLSFLLDHQIPHYPGMLSGLARHPIIDRIIFDTGLLKTTVLKKAHNQEETFKKQWEKKKNYTPYVHPSQILSARAIWKHFSPKLDQDYAKLSEVSVDEHFIDNAVGILYDLYIDQKNFSPEMLRNVLQYQENQYREILPSDRSLPHEDLHLFYARSLNDFFLDGVSQEIALSLYKLYDEAREHKTQIQRSMVKKGVQSLFVPFAKGEGKKFLQMALLREEISKRDLEQAMSMLMTIDQYLDTKISVAIDRDEVSKAHEEELIETKIALYQLQPDLVISSEKDLLGWDIYLAGTTKRKAPLDFTASTLDPRCAESDFVVKNYEIEYAMIDQRDLEKNLLVKDVLAWQMSDHGWNFLHDQFAELIKKDITTYEKRKEALDALSFDQRRRVDEKTRNKMVQESPFQIREELSSRQSKVENVAITFGGSHPAFGHLIKKNSLIALLDQQDSDVEAQKKLSYYSEDGRYYFRIKVLSKDEKARLLTYQEAKEKGILDQLIEKKLQKIHREKFADKPFDQVEKELLQEAVAPLLSYARKLDHGFYLPSIGDFMLSIQELEKNHEQERERPSLLGQYQCEKKEKILTKVNNDLELSPEVFSAPEKSLSDVEALPNGNVVFYQILSRALNQVKLDELVSDLENQEKNKARHDWMQNWLQQEA